MKTNSVITKKVNKITSNSQVSDQSKLTISDDSVQALTLHQNEAILAQMRVDFRGKIVPFPPKRVNTIKMSA